MDARALLADMARSLIPAYWPQAPFLFIGLESESLGRDLKQFKLPRFLAVGLFICNDPVSDKSKEGSFLYVSWEQAKLEPQISPENYEAIVSISWSSHASDFSW